MLSGMLLSCNTKEKQSSPLTCICCCANAAMRQGWGTSLCWFANILGSAERAVSTAGIRGKLPAQLPVREFLADLLFDSEKGLGLQICRYNIGGSGWNTIDTGNFRYGADVPRCAFGRKCHLCPSVCCSDHLKESLRCSRICHMDITGFGQSLIQHILAGN